MNMQEFEEKWAKKLYIEVMQDYLREAEMSYTLIDGKDAEYYERMRNHFNKLKAFISSLLRSQHENCSYNKTIHV